MRMQGSHDCTWLPSRAVLHFLRSPAFSRLKQRPFSYPCANHSRIFRVTQRAGLASILQTFLRRIFNEGTSAVEHASQVRGHFALAGGVWPGCLASAFFFSRRPKALSSDGSMMKSSPGTVCFPEILHPTVCASADDFAVAAPSFRALMPIIVLTITRSAVGYNMGRCETLSDWNCDQLSRFPWSESL